MYLGASENRSGNLVSSVVYKKSSGTTSASYSYTYDAKDNITEIYKGSTLIASYAYDSLGQMIREDCVDADKTYLYTYDGLGNILSKSEYPFTPAYYEPAYGSAVYSYGYTSSAWGDLLTEYNGTAITYDAIGNPLSYYNGTAYTFTWQGRTLSAATVGGVTSSYVYDLDGLRTRKTVGTTVYDYYWNNSKLSAMTITNGSNITTMMFAYDPEGMPFAMSYNGTVYYYCTDIQGNVLGLFNEYGLCAYYEYDAWGNILDQNAAGSTDYNALMANPLRYRGYIYDTETELYYLQSRYYDPATGRFLNADDVMFLGATGTVISTNLFAYCENDTVNKTDYNGNTRNCIWLYSCCTQ